MNFPSRPKIGILGLGYVGLPLAVEFGKQYETVGLDISASRIAELRRGEDRTLEVDRSELQNSQYLTFTGDLEQFKSLDVFIVTVPTPIDRHKRPDLTPLRTASVMLGRVIRRRSIVVFESTVYPGATEEECIPHIEEQSGLRYNRDFFAGYSPERINPGDKEHRVTNIVKVTSGSTPEVANYIDQLYQSIIPAGTHKASSIRVAEAAKVIENTQRDLNIALVNELAIIFSKMGIDTNEVLEAAGSKWNFLPFRPGLVGGHCIGVDPYYLTHKAEELGHSPEMILAGRRINDQMGKFVVSEVLKLMLKRRIHIKDSKILILGLTFKENCPDVRNSRVLDIVNEFEEFGAQVDVYDPVAAFTQATGDAKLSKINNPSEAAYDAIVVAVAHQLFKSMGAENIRRFGRKDCVLYDVKSIFPVGDVDGRL